VSERSYSAFRLTFHSGLHLGKGRADSYEQSLTTLHSDTLKAALFVAALELYGEDTIDESWLTGFTISSAFPFRGQEYFFPKPLTRTSQVAGVPEARQGKRLKGLRWLGRRYFEQLLAGRDVPYPEAHLHAGGFLSDQLVGSTAEPLLTHELQQHVAVPREGMADPTPYYTERLHFAPDAGLFFLVEAKRPVIMVQLVAALRLLGENGLGTDKHLGNGRFTAVATTVRLQVPANAPAQTSLSLFCPSRDDLTAASPTHPLSQYALVRRGGYLASPRQPEHLRLRKRSVYMLLEGAVLPATAQPLQGTCVDLQPRDFPIGHPVWRDGRALFIPLIPLPEPTYGG
jgi:CRISPR-associated protein Csm4